MRARISSARETKIVIPSDSHAGSTDEKRNRPHPLVGVGRDLLLRAEHRDRAVAEVVVQLRDAAADDAVGLLPRPTLLQHGLANPPDEERLKKRFVRLVEEQIAVKLTVAQQGFFEDEAQHCLGLLDLAEGVTTAVEVLEGFGKIAMDRLPGRFDALGRGI